jgi:hypothetical protein
MVAKTKNSIEKYFYSLLYLITLAGTPTTTA